MKFTHGGINYFLEFERKHKSVTTFEKVIVVKESTDAAGKVTRKEKRENRQKTVPSKYPFTTARLLEARGEKVPNRLAQGVVGCLPSDAFSHEKGRLAALKELSYVLRKQNNAPEGLLHALWDSYLSRKREQPIEQPVVVVSKPPVKELGPATDLPYAG